MSSPLDRLKQQAAPDSEVAKFAQQYKAKADEADEALRQKQERDREARMQSYMERLRNEDW